MEASLETGLNAAKHISLLNKTPFDYPIEKHDAKYVYAYTKSLVMIDEYLYRFHLPRLYYIIIILILLKFIRKLISGRTSPKYRGPMYLKS